MRFLFAGGGTGGHIFPGLAVAEAVRRLEPSAEIIFLGTGRPLDRELIPAAGHRLVEQTVRPFPSRPWHAPAFLWHWFRSKRLVGSVLDAGGLAVAGGPESQPGAAVPHSSDDDRCVVLGLGGYAAGPAIRVAAKRGIPSAILNPDLIPGRSNEWAGGYVREIYCQWIESRGYFRSGAEKVVATGCPLRGNIGKGDRAEAAREFNLDPSKRTLLVTGASQGAKSINDALVRMGSFLDARSESWQVLHLTGRREFDLVEPQVRGRKIAYRAVAFTTRMDLAYALADLAIGRAGAGSLAEFTAVGLPSILLPYPFHADRHQHANAQVLADAGAAVVFEDRIEAEGNAAGLSAVLEPLMDDAGRLSPMAAAAKAMGKPNAAADIAARLSALCS